MNHSHTWLLKTEQEQKTVDCKKTNGYKVQKKFTLLKLKVLHDAIEEPFLSKWFHKEPLTSEEPFCFTKGFVVAKEGSSDYKKVRKTE